LHHEPLRRGQLCGTRGKASTSEPSALRQSIAFFHGAGYNYVKSGSFGD